MKILFVWRKIDRVAGGVERMITTIMNEMRRRGHDVSLLTWDRKGAKSFYEMDEKIDLHCLDMGDPMQKAGLVLRLKRAPKIRKIVKSVNPDVIICFESGIFLSIKMYLLGYRIPIIAAERNAPSRLDLQPFAHKKSLIFQSLRLADRITVQFERYIQDYPPYLHNRMFVIPNPVKQAASFADPRGKKGELKALLTVTRLAYQKNNDSLVKAFSRLAPDFPDWELVIAGGDEDGQKIKTMVSELGMNDKIKLPGPVKDVEALYKKAHLFCLPSRWEGFPNALAEALAHGLPAVGYAGCCGVRDLINDGVNGLLADGNGNIETLEKTLRTLMADDEKRAQMGAAAVKSVAPYKPQQIFDLWERLFKETAKKS